MPRGLLKLGQSQREELQGFIRTAAATGLAMHEVEQGLFKRLLELGYQLQQWLFALLGDGDRGETLTPGEGRVLRRLPNLHCRAYQSIFGCFDLERVAYGTREGQRIEHVPLDARVSLPAGKFSYLARRTGIRHWRWRVPISSSMACCSGCWGLSSRWRALRADDAHHGRGGRGILA
jgi:hypothetical protein